ncbi:nucleotide-diphospho-sugar transferase [Schizophyllum amplum]|uniref:Nucleotide-diphospho-sugar transferase n=1 Tax=Schizophyllum amplum TaxID=97359 RepID=A0A550C529_9AGAR|nr:nucleotide-diphospho-sugar transferase [Auriculariopsis ampla]
MSITPQLTAHLLLTLTNYKYRTFAASFGLSPDGLFLQHVLYEQPATLYNDFAPDDARANATFVVLARNSEVKGVEQSIRDLEARFNAQYQYPYVFLNDEEFTDAFKGRVLALTSAPVEFGLIPAEHWNQPGWIDEGRALASRKKMQKDGVMYGGAYRNMCRFNSGFFYRHPLMLKYRYYWRIEPEVHFHCDINFDPFLFMQQNKKVYGFTMSVYEIAETISSLWSTVSAFVEAHPAYLAAANSLDFVSSDRGATYNLCHFWSNFEIGDMEWYRGEAYSKFFDYLDRAGGFYYERWGDAPVHSLAVALFLNTSQVHFFDPIGYQHDGWSHCPLNHDLWEQGSCSCRWRGEFDYQPQSCKARWDQLKLATINGTMT